MHRIRSAASGPGRWTTALVTAGLALGLATCGGTGTAEGPASTPPAPTSPAPATTPQSGQLTARFAGSNGSPQGYYEYLPPGYGTGEPRPLVFLHGFGENGDGSAGQLERIVAEGIPELIDGGEWPAERPFVVLAPTRVRARPKPEPLRPVALLRAARLDLEVEPARVVQRLEPARELRRGLAG